MLFDANPVAFPVAVAGAVALLATGSPGRSGVAAAAVVRRTSCSAASRTTRRPAVLFSLAAGAVPLDRWATARRLWVVGTAFVVVALAVLPIELPVLPLRRPTGTAPRRAKRLRGGDRLGPPRPRRRAALRRQRRRDRPNYGEAGALGTRPWPAARRFRACQLPLLATQHERTTSAASQLHPHRRRRHLRQLPHPCAHLHADRQRRARPPNRTLHPQQIPRRCLATDRRRLLRVASVRLRRPALDGMNHGGTGNRDGCRSATPRHLRKASQHTRNIIHRTRGCRYADRDSARPLAERKLGNWSSPPRRIVGNESPAEMNAAGCDEIAACWGWRPCLAWPPPPSLQFSSRLRPYAASIAISGAGSRCGMRRTMLVQLGIHQFASPKSFIRAGTRRARITVASKMIPAARPIARDFTS